MYKTKDISGATIVKDVDIASRMVTGYFSVFNNKDSDGDIIRPGSYTKTIGENGPSSARPRIMHLAHHDTQKPIGLLQTLEENSHGVYFESVLSKSSTANDILIMYDEGILKEHSVGINVLAGEPKDDYFEITEVKMWEGSTVTWGANEMALVSKSLTVEETDELIEKLAGWQGVLRKGNVSDEACNLLSIQIAQVESYIKSLQAERSLEADKRLLGEINSIIN